MIKKDYNRINFSSNINEVIRAVLNFLFFFTKIFPTHKKHLRHKDTQARAQNANKQIRDYFLLRCFSGAVFIFVRL